jgi:transposase
VKADGTTHVPYRGVWRSLRLEHQGPAATDCVLVVWSAGKQRLDEQKRKTYLKRLLNQLASVRQKLNTGRYRKRAYVEQRLPTIQRGDPTKDLVEIDLEGEEDEALALTFRNGHARSAAAQALNGRYPLATNAPLLDVHQALRLFKGQDGVEKRFRVVKGPLLVRPLFVHSDRRVEGLVFITLLALLVHAILEWTCRQQELEVTAQKLFGAFELLQAVDLIWRDGNSQRRASEMTAFRTQVLEMLDSVDPIFTV